MFFSSIQRREQQNQNKIAEHGKPAFRILTKTREKELTKNQHELKSKAKDTTTKPSKINLFRFKYFIDILFEEKKLHIYSISIYRSTVNREK